MIVTGEVALLAALPLLGIAFKDVIVEFPVALCVIVTLTLPTPPVGSDATELIVGAWGTVEIATEFEAAVEIESPFAFTAFSRNVYDDPEFNPGIDRGLEV